MFGEGIIIVQKSADRWRCKSNIRGNTKNGFVKHRNVVSQLKTTEFMGFLKIYLQKKQEYVFTATTVIMPKKKEINKEKSASWDKHLTDD